MCVSVCECVCDVCVCVCVGVCVCVVCACLCVCVCVCMCYLLLKRMLLGNSDKIISIESNISSPVFLILDLALHFSRSTF